MKLVLFDCDGTLADSQHEIVAAMGVAFAECGAAVPPASAIRAAIGLSLPRLIADLTPSLAAGERAALVDAYRAAYLAARSAPGAQAEPLFDGIADTIERLLVGSLKV